MQRWAKRAVLGLFGLLVAVSGGGLSTSELLYGETECPKPMGNETELDAYKTAVRQWLPSLTDFRLVKLSTLKNGFSGVQFIFPLDNVDSMKEATISISDSKELSAGTHFAGVVVDARGSEIGSATLYDGQERFFSGLVSFRQNNEQNLVFMELLGPLLRPYDPALADCSETSDAIHIVYNARQMNFKIVLDRSGSRGQHRTSPSRNDPAAVKLFSSTEDTQTPSAIVVGVADGQFSEFYSSGTELWNQRIEDTLSHVESIFRDVVILTHTIDQVDYLDGEWGAFNLLCRFAQGLVILDDNNDTVLNPFGEFTVEPGTFVDNSLLGTVQLDSTMDTGVRYSVDEGSGLVVVHLFSGQQLQQFNVGVPVAMTTAPPATLPLSDSGCCFCYNDSCGGWKGQLVAMAEGIGQLRRNTSSFCSPTPIDFANGRHHSVSQQVPVYVPSSDAINDQALLAQRLYLAAHEIGHNLGAEHSFEINTLMSPELCVGSTTLCAEVTEEEIMRLTLGESYNNPSCQADGNLGDCVNPQPNSERIRACLINDNCDL